MNIDDFFLFYFTKMIGGSAAQSSTLATFDATLGVWHSPGNVEKTT